MSVTVIQTQRAGHDDGSAHTTTTATFDSTPTAGRTLVAVIALFAPVIDKNVNTPAGWTARTASGGEWTDPQTIALFTKVSNGAETGVTITYDSVTQDAVHIFEVNGAWGGHAHDFGGGSSFSIPSISPAAGLDVLLLAISTLRSPYNISSGPAGYILRQSQVTGVRMSTWDRSVNPTSGSYSGTVTYVGVGFSHRIHAYFTGTLPPPVADFEADVTAGVVPTTVCFTDLSTGVPTSWAWTFGDGGTSTSQNPCHTYTVSGLYDVTLTATNAAGSDSETKSLYIRVSEDVGFEEPLPGGPIIEIYTAEAGAARWDDATWDDDIWSTSAWQNITPESVDAKILWGSSAPEYGILSRPSAGSWSVAIYDPDRVLDPANEDSPYFTDLIPYLPIRVTHRTIVIRQGFVESITHAFDDDSGTIRVFDSLSVLANAQVPNDTSLSNTLFARAVDAISAAGLGDSVTVLPVPPSGDPAVAAWVTAVNDWSAWQWIQDAAEQALHIPYVDRIGRVGFRPWADPMSRGRTLDATELVGLVSVVDYTGMYSEVSALDSITDTVETRALTPPPRYGVRTYERTDSTLDAGDWATAVLLDRSFSALRWVPGTTYPLTADSVELLATIEAGELVALTHGFTDPEVLASLIIVGGEITITAKKEDEAKWWFTFHAAQTTSVAGGGLPLVTEDEAGFITDETGFEYVYPD